jgi:hypothetical protein
MEDCQEHLSEQHNQVVASRLPSRSPVSCVWVELPCHQLPLCGASQHQVTARRCIQQLHRMLLCDTRATATASHKGPGSCVWQLLPQALGSWLGSVHTLPALPSVMLPHALVPPRCSLGWQPLPTLHCSAPRTSSWLGAATYSVMTVGVRGSSAATLLKRPVAHQLLRWGRYATCTGWLLRPSNLSRHLQ